MTRGSAFTLKLCRRNILWLVGALMLVILFHLYVIKVIKTVTRDDDHFLSLPKEFLSPSHKKVSMNRFRIHLKEQCIPYTFSFHFKLRCSVLFEGSVSSSGRAKRRSFRVNTVNVLLPRKMFLFLKKKSDIGRFHSRDQHLCKCIGTIGSIYIRKRFISHRTPTWTSFHCFGTQYGRHDVTWICSIPRCSCPQKRETRVKVSPGSPLGCPLGLRGYLVPGFAASRTQRFT